MSSKKNNKQDKQKNNAESKPTFNKTSLAVEVENNKKENTLFYYIGLGIVLVLIFLIRKNFLNIPFERDEGAYTYTGQNILDGAIPYKDIGSQRLDGIFYAYSLLVWIFGYSVKAMHIAFIFVNMATAIIIFFLTRKLSNYITGFAAATFFAIMSMAPTADGFTVQSEHLVILFVMPAFLSLFYFFETKKIGQLVLSGILFSLAFEIKQTCFFFGLLGGALLLFKGLFEDRSGIKKNIIHVLIFSLSVLIPLAFDLLMVYKHGAWADFKIWFFDIRQQYTSNVPFDKGWENFKINFFADYNDYKLFWIFSFLAMISVFFIRIPLWKKITVVGLNMAGFLSVLPGFHFEKHYYLLWIVPISISAAIFIFSVQNYIIRFKNNVAYVLIPLLLIIIPVCINLKELSGYYFKPNYTMVLRSVYGINPFPESKVIADKLNSVMTKDDKLAVFGTEIQMYVYTNKKSPSRFAGSGALLEFPVKQSEDWQKEFIADVEKAAPRFLVFFQHPISWNGNPKTKNLIFPWFDKFAADNYSIFGYADMMDTGSTNYVWQPDIDLTNNPPKGQFKVFVFERKQSVK